MGINLILNDSNKKNTLYLEFPWTSAAHVGDKGKQRHIAYLLISSRLSRLYGGVRLLF